MAIEFRSSWIIATIGCIFFVFGTSTIIWNEKRALNSNEVLNEAFEDAVSFTYDPEDEIDLRMYNGRTIHISGPLNISEPLIEPAYNIKVFSVLLRRRVQMYQWIEDNVMDWHDSLIDYRKFFIKTGHQNPDNFPVESRTQLATKVSIGNLRLGNEAKYQIDNFVQITSDLKSDDPSIKLHLGLYYHTKDIFNPEIGDIRILFTCAGLQGDIYSVVGKMEDGRIVPVETSRNTKILLVYRGKLSIMDLFHKEERALRFMTWCFRVVAITLMFFATICTLSLIHTLLDPIGILSFLVPDPHHPISTSLMFSFTISYILITISWFAFRPLVVAKVILVTLMPIMYCSQNYEIALVCILGMSFFIFHFRLW